MMHFAEGIEVVQATMIDLQLSGSHACGTSKQSSTPFNASRKSPNPMPTAIDKGKDKAGATAQVAGVVEARSSTPQAREEVDWNPLSSPGAEDWQVSDTIGGMAVFSNFPGSSGSPKGVVVEFMDQKW